MHPLFNALQNIAQHYPDQEKILLMSSYQDGNTLKKSLTRENFSTLNLRIITLFDLARKMCFGDILKNQKKMLDETEAQLFVLQKTEALLQRQLLSYFQVPFITTGIAKTIFKTLKEFRISGYNSREWPSHIMVNKDKSNDLFQIMLAYETWLEERNFFDEANIFQLALTKSLPEAHKVYIIPSNLSFYGLERTFFEQKLRLKTEVIYFPYVKNQESPASMIMATKETKPENCKTYALDYLYQVEKCPPYLSVPKINFYQCYGEFMEAKTVIREIKVRKIPLDQVQIFYTVQEPYSQYLY